MKRSGIILLALLLCLALGWFSVGPDYHRKDPAVPNRFGSVEQGITTSGAVGMRAPQFVVEDPPGPHPELSHGEGRPGKPGHANRPGQGPAGTGTESFQLIEALPGGGTRRNV